MALPPGNPTPQLGKRQSASRSAVQEASGLPAERGRGEKGEDSDDARPMSSFLPQVNVKNDGLRDLTSIRVWRNHVIWRAGVSELFSKPSTFPLLTPIFPDHRGNSFRVTELCVWSTFRHALHLATLSCTGGDPLRQRHPGINHRLCHGFSNGGTHQPDGDNSHCALWALSPRSSDNLRLLPARRGCSRWIHPPRSPRQEIRIRDSQRWLLDRSRRRGRRLASGSD